MANWLRMRSHQTSGSPVSRRTAGRGCIIALGLCTGICCVARGGLVAAAHENGAATNALALMTAPDDRSWKHMVETGATITWEAWDQRYKPNQDWNHAWGAAPANLLPRFVLGVQPFAPGWKRAVIRPYPAP